MVFGRVFGKPQKARFICVYKECESLCCKDNLMVLNENDIQAFQDAGIDIENVTERFGLNTFLEILGSTPIKQLDGLLVLRLKKNSGGSCFFLETEDGGCKIYAHRPYYCREFPFKFPKGKIKTKDNRCPGLRQGDEKDLKEVRKELGLDGVEIKPPYLVGEETKLKTSRTLMSMVFKLMK